jgi:hypothetical protein
VFAPGDRRIGPKTHTRPAAPGRLAVKRVTRLGDVVGSHGALPSRLIGKL